MEFLLYLDIVRRQWIVIAAVTLLATMASLVFALIQPARYSATARMLVTFADPARVDIEDPLAYDLPAIVHGRPFTQDVAVLLTSQSHSITADELMQAISATNQKREVFLTAVSPDPALPVAILHAAVTQLQTGGLRYWGSAAIVAEHSGVSIVLLDIPEAAQQLNSPVAIAREVILRTLAGLAVGCGLAFGMHAVRETKGQK